jgi:hypothetical protein
MGSAPTTLSARAWPWAKPPTTKRGAGHRQRQGGIEHGDQRDGDEAAGHQEFGSGQVDAAEMGGDAEAHGADPQGGEHEPAAAGARGEEADDDERGEMVEAEDGMAEAGEQALQEGGRRRAAHRVVGEGRARRGEALRGRRSGGSNDGRHRGGLRQAAGRIRRSSHRRSRTHRDVRTQPPAEHPVRWAYEKHG